MYSSYLKKDVSVFGQHRWQILILYLNGLDSLQPLLFWTLGIFFVPIFAQIFYEHPSATFQT
jgi:hypothetical protein